MIGVCVEDEERAEKFIRWLVGETAFEESAKIRPWFNQVETNMCIIQWMQPSRNFKAHRLNYIYTTKEILDSEWFKTVVRPMLVGGCGYLIDIEE